MIGVNRENEKPYDGTDEVVPLIQIFPLAVPTPPTQRRQRRDSTCPPPLTSYPFFGPHDSPPRRRCRSSVKTKSYVKVPTKSSHRQFKPMNSNVAS